MLRAKTAPAPGQPAGCQTPARGPVPTPPCLHLSYGAKSRGQGPTPQTCSQPGESMFLESLAER